MSLNFLLTSLNFLNFPFQKSSLQFCVKGLSGDAEHFGGTRDIAVAFIHDLPDVIVLKIFQGCHFRIVVDGILEYPYQFVIIPGLGDEIGGSAFQSLDG